MQQTFLYCSLFLVLFPFAAGLCGYALGRRSKSARDLLVGLATALEFAGCLALWPMLGQSARIEGVLGLGLGFTVDGLRLTLCCLAGFLWLMTTLFSRDYLAHANNRNRYYMLLLFTLGGIQGVFLSADLYTTLVFFEVMSFASWVLVIQEETPGAVRAADSYLAFAVIGGLSTLMGLFLLYHLLGTLEISQLAAAAAAVENKGLLYLAGAFTLGGFAAKAGMFPLHTWLPAAHPVAPAPASALLSGIITKAGMYGIFVLAAHLFLHDAAWGAVMLAFGVVTMATGAVLAVFSVDLKRTLACSSMSQIGFILVGVGMQGLLGGENGLAVWGSVLHVLNHSLLKLCLFMAAGVVVKNLHQLDLNDIRGFGRGKPVLLFAFLMGAVGLGGVPGFNGYISKTLLHESIVEYIEVLEQTGGPAALLRGVEWVFLISGGLSVAYMTKLFVVLFVEKHPTRQAEFDALNGRYMTGLSTVVLAVSAALVPVLGLAPHFTMDQVAGLAQGFFSSEGPAHAVAYFSAGNLKGAAISLAIGAAVYFGVVRTWLCPQKRYANRLPRWLDLENSLYRPLLLGVLPFVGAFFARVAGSLLEWCVALANKILFWRAKPTVTPRSDEAFGAYRAKEQRAPGFSVSLSYSLLLYGFGLVGILVYLLFF